jgi:hypothetical protein
VTSFADVRAIATSLPETEEILTWGTDVTFRVRKKIFAIGSDGADRVSIKATLEEQADLIALDSETFGSSAYVGRFGWTTVALDRVDEPMLRRLLVNAWRSVAPKRLLATAAATGIVSSPDAPSAVR